MSIEEAFSARSKVLFLEEQGMMLGRVHNRLLAEHADPEECRAVAHRMSEVAAQLREARAEDNAKQQIDELATERAALKKENIELKRDLGKANTCVSELERCIKGLHDGQSDVIDELREELAAAARENENLARFNEELAASGCTHGALVQITLQRDQIEATCEKLTEENDHLIAENRRLVASNNGLQTANLVLSGKRDAAEKRAELFRLQREALRAQIESHANNCKCEKPDETVVETFEIHQTEDIHGVRCDGCPQLGGFWGDASCRFHWTVLYRYKDGPEPYVGRPDTTPGRICYGPGRYKIVKVETLPKPRVIGVDLGVPGTDRSVHHTVDNEANTTTESIDPPTLQPQRESVYTTRCPKCGGISDGRDYLTAPIQHRCASCGTFWFPSISGNELRPASITGAMQKLVDVVPLAVTEEAVKDLPVRDPVICADCGREAEHWVTVPSLTNPGEDEKVCAACARNQERIERTRRVREHHAVNVGAARIGVGLTNSKPLPFTSEAAMGLVEVVPADEAAQAEADNAEVADIDAEQRAALLEQLQNLDVVNQQLYEQMLSLMGEDHPDLCTDVPAPKNVDLPTAMLQARIRAKVIENNELASKIHKLKKGES